LSDQFHLLAEPLLQFGSAQDADDPHDGLALFGPAEATSGLPGHVAIGTPEGLALWRGWVVELNSAAACDDPARHRPWPPFPGYDVAFGCKWPNAIKEYSIDAHTLAEAARKGDRFERVFSVSNAYLEPIEKQVPLLDAKPALAVCIVPDDVHTNCRPKSYVADPTDQPKSVRERRYLSGLLSDRRAHQGHLAFVDEPENLAQYGMAPDFRRQIKARVMEYDVPIQIVRESTLTITEQVRRGLRGTNSLSDRLWNLGTTLFYKCGRKPWKTPWAREGVCYVGLAFRRDERDRRTACCAAQMFLDSGDGIVFVGEFGPWYSEQRKEYHLSKKAAESLLRGTIETYAKQEGRKLSEVFLHSRSGLDPEEFLGFKNACPQGVELVGIRVRKDRMGPRLFRHDDHPEPTRQGKYPVLRGTFWQRTERHGLLFTSGFKPRIASYDGWEIPVPLSITIQHGQASLVQVATDILGLTKLNYNACRLGESQPITVKYSDRIGEILLANPEVPPTHWKHNFKFYI
jgi:hypothetical protein